jgi:DNA-binding transcriptional ArsR family regulator
MDDAEGLPRVAALIAEPARARMLWTLIDGTTRPAGELAYAASVSAQSASAHLAKLVEGGLLEASAQGRHRYYRIASAEVAAAVEALASLGAATGQRRPPARLAGREPPAGFLRARTCYGHLAGEIAVGLLDSMVKARWLAQDGADFRVTATGEPRLEALGLDLAATRLRRRAFARACVDLTQRRPHLGGALGDALLELYLERGWVQRSRRSRVVSVTPRGQQGFEQIIRPTP